MATAYIVNPQTDLVGNFKGQAFCIQHHYDALANQQQVLMLVQQGTGDWVRRGGNLIIEESELKRLGPVEYIASILVQINAWLKGVFGDPDPTAPVDMWLALDQTFQKAFAFRYTETGVEMVRKV